MRQPFTRGTTRSPSRSCAALLHCFVTAQHLVHGCARTHAFHASQNFRPLPAHRTEHATYRAPSSRSASGGECAYPAIVGGGVILPPYPILKPFPLPDDHHSSPPCERRGRSAPGDPFRLRSPEISWPFPPPNELHSSQPYERRGRRVPGSPFRLRSPGNKGGC